MVEKFAAKISELFNSVGLLWRLDGRKYVGADDQVDEIESYE